MAGNANSGRKVYFSVTERELQKEIDRYKAETESGEIPRASWPHFCARLGYTEAEVAEVMAMADVTASGYQERGKMLKRFATWVRGEMMSGTGWGGQMTARAIFGLKQDNGDGIAYSDRDTGSSGPVQIRVEFGGSDSRGKKASD